MILLRSGHFARFPVKMDLILTSHQKYAMKRQHCFIVLFGADSK